MIRTIAFLCAAATLAACATASRETPSLSQNGRVADGAQKPATKLAIRIGIPKHPKRAHAPRFISAATKGMTIAFAGASTFMQTIDLTPADPRCSGSPLVCRITIDAPPGGYNVTVDAYDAAPVGGAIPANSHVLSTANVALELTRGKTNSLSLTLDGLPSTVAFSNFPTANAGTAFAATPFTIAVKDASGETIVGTYATPIVLSDSDVTGATTIATSGSEPPPALTLASSSDTATIAYGGQTIAGPTIGAKGSVHATAIVFPVYLPVYVADTGANLVQEVPPNCLEASCITTLGGGWSNPYGVAVDTFGNVFVANENLPYVGEVNHENACSTSSCVIELGAGLDEVYGVAVDASENVYVADTGHGLIKEFSPDCIYPNTACVQTLPGTYGQPKGVAVDTHGNVFVADTNNARVVEIPPTCRGSDASCTIVRATGFAIPWGIAVDPGDDVFVADSSNAKIYVLSPGCANLLCAGVIEGGFSKPAGIALDSNGLAYIADAGSQKIIETTPGCISACGISLGFGFDQPWGVAIQKL